MKQREERRKVVLKARMRSDAAWSDVCIVNISSRGIGMQASNPPPRGTYVEVCKGHHVIVARVAWTCRHRFGVSAQNVLPIDSIVNDVGDPKSRATDRASAPVPFDRRPARRSNAAQADRSRLAGRAMEFACLGMAVAAGAMLLFGLVEQTFARTITSVEAGFVAAP